MRKLSALAATLLLSAFATTANAQLCIDFVDFCDGLELTVGPEAVSGTWQNFVCDGRDAPVVGARFGQGGSVVLVACIASQGCTLAQEIGLDLLAVNILPQSIVELYDLSGNLLNSATISVAAGACPFKPQNTTPAFSAS